MSDIAEGSTAVRQLQQNVAAAPYVQDLTQAASERKIQEDRLAKQYAPQIAAAQAEEEQMRLQTTRLQKLATDNQYKADTESTAKLQQWLQTDDGKKASDLDITKKSASLKMQAGLTEQGAKLYERADKIQAQELATQTKQLAQDNDTIAKAAVVLDAVPPEKVDEFFGRLPEEQKKLILKQVGEENWTKATGEEKKKIVDRLFLNAKGQLTEQMKAIEVEKAKIVAKNREDVQNLKNDGAVATKVIQTESAERIATEKSDTTLQAQRIKDEAALERVKQKGADDLERQKQRDEDAMERLKATNASKKEIEELQEKSKKELKQMADKTKKEIEAMKEAAAKNKPAKVSDPQKAASFYFKEHDKIVKAGQKQEEALQLQVNVASNRLDTSKDATWFSPIEKLKEDKRAEAYKTAKDKLNNFRKEQAEEELAVIESAPDFPNKDRIIKKLKDRIALVELPPDKEEPPPAKTTTAKSDVPGGAGATSNKYTQDKPATPASQKDYDALPPGSYYIQDGVTKRKKG